MNKIISPQYLNRLDKERQETFRKLETFREDFILAGGTAIMLQIGHRLSYDFDLFTTIPFPDNLLDRLTKVFGRVRTLLLTDDIILIITSHNVDIHFVYHPFKELKTPLQFSAIRISHLDDLAANKAHTLGRRPAWRDYVDIFFLLKWKHFDLQQMISLAEKKFGFEFNSKLFLEQLTYFSDVKIVQTIFLKEHYNAKTIQSFLTAQVRNYLKEIL